MQPENSPQNNTQNEGSDSRRGWLPIILGVVFSLGAIFLVFREVDAEEVWEQVQAADARYLLAMMGAYPVAMAARAYRWKFLFENSINFWRGFHIINIGYFLNATLPLRLGEFARILLVSREPKQNIGTGLSAVTVERLFDLMMALLCVGLGLALVPESKALPDDVREGIGFFIVVTVLGSLVLLALPRSHPLLLRIARFVLRPFPEAIGGALLTFAEDTLNSLRAISDIRILLTVLGWSIVTWISYTSFFYIGLFGFFDSVNLGLAFLVIGFVAVGIAAPSLPGAVGIFQAAAVLALSTTGHDTAAATGYAWTLWIVQTVAILLGGVVGLWAMSLSFGGLTQDVRENLEKIEVHHDS